MNDATEEPLARLVPPGERGATRISDRVVAKLAAEAAREALRAMRGRVETPWAAHSRGQFPEATVSVRRNPGADGSAGLAFIRVAVELGYPSDIGAQCSAVRHQVVRRVGELAGMDAPDVAVDVQRLYSEHLTGEGRVL
jgi:uncharacterized alkaline shock family protein YloU